MRALFHVRTGHHFSKTGLVLTSKIVVTGTSQPQSPYLYQILFVDYATNEVCMDYSLVIGLIVTWIIVQLIFVIACIALVKRYKKYYEQEYRRASMEDLHKNFGLGFSNLENRRVRWADNGDNIM